MDAKPARSRLVSAIRITAGTLACLVAWVAIAIVFVLWAHLLALKLVAAANLVVSLGMVFVGLRRLKRASEAAMEGRDHSYWPGARIYLIGAVLMSAVAIGQHLNMASSQTWVFPMPERIEVHNGF